MTMLLLSGLVLWGGATLLLAELPWFSRQPLSERLRPYSAQALATPARRSWLSAESFRDVLGPLSRAVGSRVARLFGVGEELAVRLERVHSPLDVTAFRLRQLGWGVAGLGGSALAAAALRPPPGVVVFLLLNPQSKQYYASRGITY